MWQQQHQHWCQHNALTLALSPSLSLNTTIVTQGPQHQRMKTMWWQQHIAIAISLSPSLTSPTSWQLWQQHIIIIHPCPCDYDSHDNATTRTTITTTHCTHPCIYTDPCLIVVSSCSSRDINYNNLIVSLKATSLLHLCSGEATGLQPIKFGQDHNCSSVAIDCGPVWLPVFYWSGNWTLKHYPH